MIRLFKVSVALRALALLVPALGMAPGFRFGATAQPYYKPCNYEADGKTEEWIRQSKVLLAQEPVNVPPHQPARGIRVRAVPWLSAHVQRFPSKLRDLFFTDRLLGVDKNGAPAPQHKPVYFIDTSITLSMHG